MIVLFRVFECMTVTTLKVMFHIWFLFGLWLFSYIKINNVNETDDTFISLFAQQEKHYTRAQEDLKK